MQPEIDQREDKDQNEDENQKQPLLTKEQFIEKEMKLILAPEIAEVSRKLKTLQREIDIEQDKMGNK